MRSCRPHLGAKQSKFVTDSYPQWINVADPLGKAEAKVFSRLLETLTVKNTIRRYAGPNESEKAESLAKVFSRHSAYVLKAYIEAVNDPLCIMGSDIKRELEPGLYALCSMMSEHDRDALMVSTMDNGAKIVIKGLWKEYEKQRYAGQG